MSITVFMVGLAVVLGVYMAWGIGANDAANSMADAVGAGAISIRRALILAAVCEFAGAVLVGSHVTDTVRKGIVDPSAFSTEPGVLLVGMVCALLAAAVWLHVASWMSMPVSTTHSIVGAVAGFGVVAAGWGCVDWLKMVKIVASWFISPVAGGVLAFILFKLITWSVLGRENPVRAGRKAAPFIVFVVAFTVITATIYKGGLIRLGGGWAVWGSGYRSFVLALVMSALFAVISLPFISLRLRGCEDLPLARQLASVERLCAPLVVITSCSVAFAHGANDVANAVGPLAAVADIVRSGTVRMRVFVPTWVLAVGGVGIVLGLGTYGYRVILTVGKNITQLTPSRGVAADIATASVVLVFSRLKLPISTTHTLVGAVLGVGLARGLGAINRRVTRNIFGSWIITVPATAALAAIFFLIAKVSLLRAVSAAIGAGGE